MSTCLHTIVNFNTKGWPTITVNNTKPRETMSSLRQLSLFRYIDRRPSSTSQPTAKRMRQETTLESEDHELHLDNSAASFSTSTTASSTSTAASCSTSTAASCSTSTPGIDPACTTTGATVDDIAGSVSCSPVQPVRSTFPVTYFSGKARSFNPDWFRQYEWLEYSTHKDAAFCYPCRLFGSPSACTSRPERTFTQVGFRDWKHATGAKGALSIHHSCLSHKESVVAWKQLKASSKSGSVADQLGTLRAEQIKRNNHYMTSISNVLLLCCKQEIALRGHDERPESSNRGNFLEIMDLLSRHDQIIHDRLAHGPKNAKYTSPTIQNNIIAIMASQVRSSICSSVHKAGFYSIMADETKDLSKKEQLSIIVRYVESVTVKERFLTFFSANNLNAESLSQYILDTLKQYGLDPQMIVSQGYDGASVMSGHCSGVQQRIKQVAPYAAYVHCQAHTLNLVLVDCAKNNPFAYESFALVESLYVFMSTSKAHVVFIEKQKENHPRKQLKELQRLSDT